MGYVIKNCPALINDTDYNRYINECCAEPIGIRCEDCEDCLIKKTIRLCEYNKVNDVLRLFEIKEVEE